MKILLYKGTSLISRLIRFQTRSVYSHAAVLLDDGTVYEAWQTGGVRRIATPFEGHSKGTEIDVYEIPELTQASQWAVKAFIKQHLGEKYDFSSVARFVSRRDTNEDNGKWFCSELVLRAFEAAGYPLLHAVAGMMSPRDVGISPLIRFLETIRENR
jgi:uncharacterized protein YycO